MQVHCYRKRVSQIPVKKTRIKTEMLSARFGLSGASADASAGQQRTLMIKCFFYFFG